MSRRKIPADKIMAQVRAFEQKANVSAYIILDAKGEHVATVRISYPRDGAGRLKVLCADWTRNTPEGVERSDWTPWQYGWASGCGYDKTSAAMDGMQIQGLTFEDKVYSWDRQLRDAQFRVIWAI